MILGKQAIHPPLLSQSLYIYLILTPFHNSINCRLPQTPRTPSTAAAHYFDDTFSRGHRRKSSSVGTTTPGARLRRSSTSRSIGNHSLYSPSDAGDDHHHHHHGHALTSDGGASRRDSTTAGGSDGGGTEALADEVELREGRAEQEKEKEKSRSEADGHVQRYVSEQMSRIRSEAETESVAVDEDGFEAQLD